ncbi:MAG: hypothetical protein JXQ65_00680 [Candidatus Marinimicrobia bacterium]|nr:hypothetical protein [Candidatus Neomarinimicrobiota bacterium]
MSVGLVFYSIIVADVAEPGFSVIGSPVFALLRRARVGQSSEKGEDGVVVVDQRT